MIVAATVGFLKPIKPVWMDKVTELVIQGSSNEEIRSELNEYLSYEIKSAITLRKTRVILMDSWVTPSAELNAIRQAALGAFTKSNGNRLAVQYCMLLAAYPVFADICGLIGKLSTIQDEFTTGWLKQKMFEAWGQRVTVDDSLRHILHTLHNFGFIVSPKVGTHKINTQKIEDSLIIDLILRTVLHMTGRAYYEINKLSGVTQMFPFNYAISLEWLHNSPEYVLGNYGGRMTVALK
jgi:hypothetical protein